MSSTDQVVPAPSTARKRKLNATKTNGNTSADTNERVDTILTGDDPPWPGNSYIISQLSSSKVLTCRGVLGLRLEKYTGDSSQRWCCHATDGWLEFATDPGESTVYIGYESDQPGQMTCAMRDPKFVALFCVRKRQGDGFQLLAKYRTGLRAVGKSIYGEDKIGVDENSNMAWGFTRV